MKIKKMFIRALLFALMLQSGLYAAPVFKISNDDGYFYLGGTCHILRASDFPLPKPFDTAYADSEEIYLEVDLGKMNSPVAMAAIQDAAILKDGKTLGDLLSPPVLQKLQAALEERGMPYAQIQYMTPFMATMLLVQTELAQQGVSQEGVDFFYHNKSQQDGKTVKGLETISALFAKLKEIGNDNADKLVLSTLDEIEMLETQFIEIIEAWRVYDEEAIDKLIVEAIREYPVLFEKLLIQRNQEWMETLKELTKDNDIEFVLVGVGHFTGEKGLLNLLKEAGYSVEQL